MTEEQETFRSKVEFYLAYYGFILLLIVAFGYGIFLLFNFLSPPPIATGENTTSIGHTVVSTIIHVD